MTDKAPVGLIKMNQRRIYQDFCNGCHSYTVKGPWLRFGWDGHLLAILQDGRSIIELLEEEYSKKDLIASRVAVQGDGACPVIAPRLADPPRIILPLRRHPEARPFDLLSETGTMSGRLPVCAALRDGATREGIKKVGGLFVVFGMRSLAVLRHLGFPVTMASGLRGLSPPELADFTKHFVRPQGTRLIFVNWDVFGLRRIEPAEFQDVRLHFLDLEKHLRLPMGGFLVWTPTPEDVEAVTFCVCRCSAEHIKEVLLRSMSGTLTEITAINGEIPLPEGLLELLDLLRETLRRRSGSRRLERKLWAKLETKLDDEMIAPLVRQSLDAMDPVRRNRLLGIAGISRIIHPATEALAASLARRLDRFGIRKAGRAIRDEVEPLLKLYAILLNLIKAGQ